MFGRLKLNVLRVKESLLFFQEAKDHDYLLVFSYLFYAE